MSPQVFLSALVFSAGVTASAYAANAAKVVRDNLGIQLYSLRAMTKAEGAIPVLDRVKGWGLKEVETAGTANLSVENFKKLLDERGLTAASAHVAIPLLEKDLTSVIRDLKTLGVVYGIIPTIPHKDGFDDAAALRAAEKFNAWGRAFKDAGLKLGYHPHGFEFGKSRTPGKGTVFDVLVGATDPEVVSFEMDVHWVYQAGLDPVSLLKQYPNRWVALHLRDFRKGAPRGKTPGVSPHTDMVAVGDGEIDWPAVLKLAVNLGIKHYFIEDASDAPLENIPRSIAYLRNLPLK